MKKVVGALVLGGALFSQPAFAERRTFVNVVEPEINGKDVMDVLVTTYLNHTFEKSRLDTGELEVILQYGITDHLDAAFDNFFNSTPDGALRYDRTEFELRYQPVARGEWPIDVVFQLEGSRAVGESGFGIEPKLVIGKQIDRVRLAANALVDIEIGSEVDAHPDFGAAVGVDLTEELRGGVEALADYETSDSVAGDKHELRVSAGPTLHWQPSPKLFVSSHLGFGLNSAATDVQWGTTFGIWFL